MSTPTKTPGLPQGIITPSCDITPTRETAREDAAYDDFALTQNDCSEAPEAPRDDAAPSSAPAVSVEPAYDAAEPSPSSPFTYDGAGDRAEPAGGYDSFDPFPGIPAPTKPQEPALTAEEDAPTTRALSQYEEEEDLDGVDSILDAILGEEEDGRTPSPPPINREGEAWAEVARLRRQVASLTRLRDAVDRSLDADRACAQRLRADALEVRKMQRALRGLRQLHRAYAERDQPAPVLESLLLLRSPRPAGSVEGPRRLTHWLTSHRNARQVRALIQAEREQRALLEEATLRECAAYERGVNDAERTLLEPTVRKQIRAERRERFAEAVSAAVRRACLQAVGVGVLVGATVYYFHDDGTDFQVPARVAHHVELALTHAKLAFSS